MRLRAIFPFLRETMAVSCDCSLHSAPSAHGRLMEALSHAISEHPLWWSAADAQRRWALFGDNSYFCWNHITSSSVVFGTHVYIRFCTSSLICDFLLFFFSGVMKIHKQQKQQPMYIYIIYIQLYIYIYILYIYIYIIHLLSIFIGNTYMFVWCVQQIADFDKSNPYPLAIEPFQQILHWYYISHFIVIYNIMYICTYIYIYMYLSYSFRQESRGLVRPSPGYPADDILLAILGFPRHRCVATWCDALTAKISQSSLALLPALLLSLERSEAGAEVKMGESSRKMLMSCEIPMKNWWDTLDIDEIVLKLMVYLYLWNWGYTLWSSSRLLKWWFHQQISCGLFNLLGILQSGNQTHGDSHGETNNLLGILRKRDLHNKLVKKRRGGFCEDNFSSPKNGGHVYRPKQWICSINKIWDIQVGGSNRDIIQAWSITLGPIPSISPYFFSGWIPTVPM